MDGVDEGMGTHVPVRQSMITSGGASLPRRIMRFVAIAGSAALLAACSTSRVPEPTLNMVPESNRTPIMTPALPLPSLAPPKNMSQKPAGASMSLAHERKDGVQKVGKPYSVAGRWYIPRHQPNYDDVGMASWYGPNFHGKSTANGELYNMDRLTAAHPTLPMPSYVSVTNLSNNRTIIVRVNDRGPYARGRIIDLSKRSAQLLGYTGHGTARVRVKYVGPAPMGADDSFEQKFLAQQSWYAGHTAMSTPSASSALGEFETETIAAPAATAPLAPVNGWDSAISTAD